MNKSNLRNSWRILKEVINKKKRSTVSSKFIVNNSVITDKKSVANGFNTFFTNIGPTLANNIPSTNLSATNYIRQGRLKDIKQLGTMSPGCVFVKGSIAFLWN